MAVQEAQDTGLGLTEFLKGGSSTEGDKPTPAAEPIETEEPKAEPPKQEGLKQEASKTEEKPAEKTAEIPNKETQKQPWELESDSYKERHAYAAKWANDVHQQNIKLLREIENISKRLDGTYDPAKDEPQLPTPEEMQRNGILQGRIEASKGLATRMYGEEAVQKLILDENSPFSRIEGDPYVRARVLASEAPIMEAMTILEERAFQAKWGKTPREIESSIRKKVEEELTQTITEKVTKQFNDRLALKDRQVQTLGDVRGAEGKQPLVTTPKPLDSIFGQ